MTKKQAKKIFVLDTSVLLFDHNSIRNFQDNNVVIPITVLEELDNFKIGNDTKNFEARSVIRFLDKISEHQNLNEWISLGENKGDLFISMHDNASGTNAKDAYGSKKNDHRIIDTALLIKESYPDFKVTLVTKDINLRIKAKALELKAEDYKTGKVEDIKKVSKGSINLNDLESDVIRELYQNNHIPENGILGEQKMANGYYIINNNQDSVLARYNPETDQIERVEKSYAYGIKPKNAEQTFAIDALLNPDIKLVALQGVAGTGKTLLALATALEQKSLYNQIILARPIIPLSNRDIGFLPGGAEEKISPYMQPLFDNLKFIKSQYKADSRKRKALDEMEENEDLVLTALAFIRGRSLAGVIMIIDESQNLTPHEVKTIITRAGEGTKIIFTGDINQIDTPYMDEHSNGLTYLIDKLKGHKLFAHIKLEKGERSELANLANDLL
ncbi:PhoH family protein [Wenyingzhuangia marina]|uniref:PhoH-like ATPase n=1 Tax=Wenyingzhuangia marina TaxID=1195760 RepID=A0A1M5W4K2_9FLAO|nr:PhoH family protein [Wenyingzhuangia marina]GGF75871.1 phosphate starvation protein PhoH [Wenyingzhuangia marina]SHH82426.1 PhoH-like ATPase [Wenyingzhuangia marina]